MQELQLAQNNMIQYSPDDVLNQVKSIQSLMSKAMKDGEHFGKIPGCGDKPTLLKAGAEKINFMFRLSAHYTITEKELPNGHREYQIVTDLIHIPSGKSFGQGVGSASTLETKWRYRNQVTKLDEPIPPDYRQNKNHYKELGFICKQENGEWGWYKKERIEHDNPADNYNTVLKMAKKRSLVDASLTSTAASDIFTQDVEELVENGIIEPKPETQKPPEEDSYLKTHIEKEVSQLDAALKEAEKSSWNGKLYGTGKDTVYLNNKKFKLSPEEIDIFKSKVEPITK